MAVGYSATLRNAKLDEITTAIGASGFLDIYDGTRPTTGGAATNLLAHLPLSATFAPAATGGTLTANAISDDADADASGTATWFRLTDSGSAFVADGDAGTGGTELILDDDAIVAGGTVAVNSLVVTAGNA